MEEFCGVSCHKINVEKSNVFFSHAVYEQTKERLRRVLGFQTVSNLGTYLVVPLFHERVTNSLLRFVVDKVRNKLQHWDARKLSLAGRVTLA